MSQDFGDILDERNFKIYKKAVLKTIKTNKPDVVLTDLHPLYNSTILGEELSKNLQIPHLKVQHHLAHIFSAVGDSFLQATSYKLQATFNGIAMDGTGYGFDGNIWGGEVFQIKSEKCKTISANAKLCKQHLNIERMGSLEEQTMIGGDLAVKEPARMLIAILAKLKTKSEKRKTKVQYSIDSKKDIYRCVKKYYSENEFELLFNQLQQDFNCQKTTSAGRILDAVSLLLGFAGNKRNFKHEATKLLEKNSSIPYSDLGSRIENYESRKILDTTHLFDYLLRNINNDRKRLAATAQLYLAKGLYEIVKNHDSKFMIHDSCFAGGGMANNRIISKYLTDNNVYISKTIPRGDEGVAFGQIVYYLSIKNIPNVKQG